MNIVPMTADDLDAVVAVEQRIQPFPWTPGNFRDSLAAGHECWIAREDVQVTAFAVTMRAVDEMHLLDIGVAPERQRTGCGRSMLEFLGGSARAVGVTRMLLEVRVSNVAACAFYQHTGFVEIGRRRGYYPADTGREDAIVMARNL